MLEIDIPGFRQIKLTHLILDHNGTLACDGILLPGVKQRLEILSEWLKIIVLTADTFANVKDQLQGVPCELIVAPSEDQANFKRDFVVRQSEDRSVCIGNGRNDRKMLKIAALGIVVIQEEGAALETILAADVVCKTINSALDMLINPIRLKATLRQ